MRRPALHPLGLPSGAKGKGDPGALTKAGTAERWLFDKRKSRHARKGNGTMISFDAIERSDAMRWSLNAATAALFFGFAAVLLWAAAMGIARAPDCLAPASCTSNEIDSQTYNTPTEVGLAIVPIGFGARVIWGMRHGA